jgi:hypothetical protein
MHITISENKTENGSGYIVAMATQHGKRRVDESDFFPDGSDIETKIQQLKKLLRQYFDANP